MRFEATLPDKRGKALIQLAKELGLSRSQLMDEALTLFLKTVLETRKGKQLRLVDPSGHEPSTEMATPSLALIEWAAHRERIEVSAQEMERIADIVENPPKPTDALKKAMAQRNA